MPVQRKPEWLKVKIPQGEQWKAMSRLIHGHGLHTVCDEAACPNKAECWGCGTATFMVLGDVCTRNCRFCAVTSGKNGAVVDAGEPQRLAGAIKELKLKYAVLTSVDRDDLPDGGAGHFAACIRAIKSMTPGVLVEVLIPDYRGEKLATLMAARPDVIAHNIETVPSMQNIRDARAGFEQSLQTLREAKAAGFITKSSLLLGLGESEAEIIVAMDALRQAGCDILVMGQYLQPGARQLPVVEYVTPARFSKLADLALQRGFSSVVSAPLARTSYHASEGYRRLGPTAAADTATEG